MKKRIYAAVATSLLIGSILTGCSASSSTAASGDGTGSDSSTPVETANTDPTKGWVLVSDYKQGNLTHQVFMKCNQFNGSLMYITVAPYRDVGPGGIATEPDSPLCKR